MKLKEGVVIEHKKKRYAGEIPDALFDQIYGKSKDQMRKKFEAAPKPKSDQQ